MNMQKMYLLDRNQYIILTYFYFFVEEEDQAMVLTMSIWNIKSGVHYDDHYVHLQLMK